MQQTEEEIKNNIEAEELGYTESGDFVIRVKNNNDNPVYIDNINVNFFDENETFMTKENTYDSYFCIPAKGEIVTYVWGYEKELEKYPITKIDILLLEPFYTYYTENFEIESNDTGEQMAISIKNNNDSELDCISVNVLYLENDKVVGIESGTSYDEGIQPNGGMAYINVDYPSDRDYDEVQFDDSKVYITSAYKE